MPNGEKTKFLFESTFPFKMVDAIIFVASPTKLSSSITSRLWRFGELEIPCSDNKTNIPIQSRKEEKRGEEKKNIKIDTNKVKENEKR